MFTEKFHRAEKFTATIFFGAWAKINNFFNKIKHSSEEN